MTGQEYTAYLNSMRPLLLQLRLMPVDDMLTHLGQVETLAPVLDPTGYQRGGHNLTDQRQVLQAVRHLQVVLDRVAGPVGAPQGGQS